MSGNLTTDALQQRTQEVCRLLAAGHEEKATAELAALDSLLLDQLSRPLSQLLAHIAQLRAEGDPDVQLAFRSLKQTASHTRQLLETIPMLSISGPHIRLATDSILDRVTTLRDVIGELPLLQADLQSLLQAGSYRQQAAGRLQAALTALNTRIETV